MIPNLVSFTNKQSLSLKKDYTHNRLNQILTVKKPELEPNTLGQILLVKKKPSLDPTDPGLGIEIRLITQKLGELFERYKIHLPTDGAQLPQDFNENQNPGQYYTFRLLVIARRISQLVAKTWLKPEQMPNEEDREKFPIIRKIILRGNEPVPEDQFPTDISKNRAEEESDIIFPSMLNWQSVYLNLLLAGQAYLERDDGTLLCLHESILSTYEAVNWYAFKLVVDDFVSKSEELIRPGLRPVPPYYLWTFPYPPRSRTDEFTQLTDDMVSAWAYADEHRGDLPFYRTSDGNFDGVEYVYPPYPYMAGSH